MLRPRLIPVLLIRNGGLVKTRRFGDDKYVGDPINAVRIFNEKEVDEISVFDIDATVKGIEPNYRFVEKIAAECQMPLCYGGGINNLTTAKRLVSLGVEKVAISSSALNRSSLVSEMATEIGTQSVVIVLDIRKSPVFGYRVYTHNGKRRINVPLTELVERFARLGAGEIVLNSIDRDGMMSGYDLDLPVKISEHCQVPMTVVGGAGSLRDVADLVSKCGTVGCGVGSLFVFKGKFRAVLINYPTLVEKFDCFSIE